MTIIKPYLLISLFLLLLISGITKAEDPKGLNIGDVAPGFRAVDQFNKQINLYEELEKGPVVLMFYRGHWCKYCNKQLEELSDSLKFIVEKGAFIITVTPELKEFVDETSKQYQDAFRIISDKEMKIMNDYKVSFEVKKTTITRYKFAGINLSEFNGDNGSNLPVPATYIINQQGIIDYVFFDENYKKRVSVKTLLMHL